MGNQILQKLAHDYATGVISQYEYRTLRTALIDEITGYQAPDSISTTDSVDEAGVPRTGGEVSNFKKYRLIMFVIVTIAIIIIAMNHEESKSTKLKATTEYKQLRADQSIILCTVNLSTISDTISSSLQS